MKTISPPGYHHNGFLGIIEEIVLDDREQCQQNTDFIRNLLTLY